MGIPTLFREIIEKYPKSHFWKSGQRIDYLFIDYNSMMYPCIARFVSKEYEKLKKYTKTKLEKAIIDEIIQCTQEFVSEFKPRKLLYMAMDGPAPRAKFVQQRNRRYKGLKITQFKEYLDKKYKNSGTKKELWSTVNLTPGTKFMEKFSVAMKKAIKGKLFASGLKVIFSDSNVPGEGEHKIIQFMRSLRALKKVSADDVICIKSPDGDLIPLSFSFDDMNVLILREKDKAIEEMGLYKNSDYLYMSMRQLADAFMVEHGLAELGLDKNRFTNDYVFFTALNGNDFVHGFPFLKVKYGGIQLLLNIYTKLLKENIEALKRNNKNSNKMNGIYMVAINKDGRPLVNTDMFRRMIEIIARSEDRNLKQRYRNVKNPRPIKRDEDYLGMAPRDQEMADFENVFYSQKEHPLYKQYKDEFAKINYDQEPHQWKAEYYAHFFAISNENQPEYNNYRTLISQKYMESLLFTLHYYLDKVPSWTWFYPFRVPPAVSDFRTTLYKKTKNVNDLAKVFGAPGSTKPYKPFDQLMLVLPSWHSDLLPKKYANLMKEAKSPLIEYYPTDYEMDVVAGGKFIYTEPLLPEINDHAVLEETAKLEQSLNASNKKRNTLQPEPFIQ